MAEWRQEMTILFKTRAEAEAALIARRRAQASTPPKWPITDMRVEARLIGKPDDPDRHRWVVAGDYRAWP